MVRAVGRRSEHKSVTHATDERNPAALVSRRELSKANASAAALRTTSPVEQETLLMIARQHLAQAQKAERPRAPTLDPVAIKQLAADGIGPTEIAKRLKISRASVYRLTAEA
jgi:hypothetical protein